MPGPAVCRMVTPATEPRSDRLPTAGHETTKVAVRDEWERPMSLPPRPGPEGYMRSVRAGLTRRQDRRAVERAKIDARLREVEAVVGEGAASRSRVMSHDRSQSIPAAASAQKPSGSSGEL